MTAAARFLTTRRLSSRALARKLVILCLEQKGVETAAMVDRLDRIGGHPQPHRTSERVRYHRDVEQIGQKPALGLDVGVTDAVAHKRPLARQFAPPRHWQTSFKNVLTAHARGSQDHRDFLDRGRIVAGRAASRTRRGPERTCEARPEPEIGPKSACWRRSHEGLRAGASDITQFDLFATERGRMASTRIAILICGACAGAR